MLRVTAPTRASSLFSEASDQKANAAGERGKPPSPPAVPLASIPSLPVAQVSKSAASASARAVKIEPISDALIAQLPATSRSPSPAGVFTLTNGEGVPPVSALVWRSRSSSERSSEAMQTKPGADRESNSKSPSPPPPALQRPLSKPTITLPAKIGLKSTGILGAIPNPSPNSLAIPSLGPPAVLLHQTLVPTSSSGSAGLVPAPSLERAHTESKSRSRSPSALSSRSGATRTRSRSRTYSRRSHSRSSRSSSRSRSRSYSRSSRSTSRSYSRSRTRSRSRSYSSRSRSRSASRSSRSSRSRSSSRSDARGREREAFGSEVDRDRQITTAGTVDLEGRLLVGRSGAFARPPGSSLSVIGLHDVGTRGLPSRLSPPRFFRSEHLFPRPRRRGRKKRGKNKANKTTPSKSTPAAAAAAAVVSAAAAAVASVLTTTASTSSVSTHPVAVPVAAMSDPDALAVASTAAVTVPNSTSKIGALAKNQELIRAALSTLSEKEAALSSVPIQVSTANPLHSFI